MAQIKFRANLSAAAIPFVSDFFSRTIIIPQIDQNVPRLAGFAGALLDNDVGIPQAYFAQNVMPTAQGLQSVGFTKFIRELAGALDFDQVIVLRDTAEERFLLSPAMGKCYIYRGDTNVWTAHNPVTLVGFTGRVTRSYLHGQTYIFFENVDGFVYDPSTDTFASAGFSGITPADMKGICNAINYNILFDDNTIYWSDPLLGNETDFTPDPLTGAGSIQIQEVRGTIIAVLPITGGFIVYTTQNAVKGLYSGNPQFPWVFSEIPGSSGVTSSEQVTFDANLPEHYAYTTAGLQKVLKTAATVEFPEASDFLSGRIIETYDYTSKLLSVAYLTSNLSVKVVCCANRYLVISYGLLPGAYTFAIIYDLALKRWGKVIFDHVDCVDFVDPSAFPAVEYIDLLGNTYASQSPNSYGSYGFVVDLQFQVPGKSIGFLKGDGSIWVVNFEVGNTEDTQAVLYLGKFQLLRKNMISLQEIEFENILQGAPFAVDILTSISGKSFDLTTQPVLNLDQDLFRLYGSRVNGLNHTLRVRGNFNLVYLGLTVLLGGNR